MSKKKHPEHVNHERWLVSYADFITLLFAFFVVLFASGQSDKKKQQKLAGAMQQAFSQMAFFEPRSKKPALNDGAGANPDTDPKPVVVPMESGGEARVEDAVKQQLAVGSLQAGDISVRRTEEGLVVSLHEGGFFASGSAELQPRAEAALKAIAGEMSGGAVRVEGHTDNVAMHSALYESNWELSSARASAIARFLLEHSTVNPSQMAVAGYAEFHPVASNATAEGRAQNRRVDVVLLAQQ